MFSSLLLHRACYQATEITIQTRFSHANYELLLQSYINSLPVTRLSSILFSCLSVHSPACLLFYVSLTVTARPAFSIPLDS